MYEYRELSDPNEAERRHEDGPGLTQRRLLISLDDSVQQSLCYSCEWTPRIASIRNCDSFPTRFSSAISGHAALATPMSLPKSVSRTNIHLI
jgi:hypothetical protein